MEKLPSKSVAVPTEVPFSMMVAPIAGSPDGSRTTPLTDVWANTPIDTDINSAKRRALMFKTFLVIMSNF